VKPLSPVTAHAILRYLKRIEGFDLAPLVKAHGRDAGNWTLAKAAAQSLGVSIDALRNRICPERLWPMVRAGACRIRREGYVLICKDGYVVSLVEETQQRAHRLYTKREAKRAIHRARRRL
jgi:hypothetical protein